MAVDASAIGRRIDTLAANLRKVEDGKAYGIDKDGETIGEALKSSFKGKVVDFLVSRGLAEEGNLAGRIAVVLVGKDNFDLITSAHSEQGHFSSVANALQLIKKHETEGIDNELETAVRRRINNSLTTMSPIGELTGSTGSAGIAELHEAIWNEVVPQRMAHREAVVAAVRAGEPTEAMIKSTQLGLANAASAIEHGVTGEAELGIGVTTELASGGQKGWKKDFENIKTDFRSGVLGIRASVAQEAADGGLSADQAQARTDAAIQGFKEDFLGAIAGQYEKVHVTDGIGVPLDGAESRPLKTDYTEDQLADTSSYRGKFVGKTPFAGGKTRFEAAAPITPKPNEFLMAEKAAREAGVEFTRQPEVRVRDMDGAGVRFDGGIQMEEYDRSAAAEVFEGVRAMLDDNPDLSEIKGGIRDLVGFLDSWRPVAKEDRLTAAGLLGNPAFHQNLDDVSAALVPMRMCAVDMPGLREELIQEFSKSADVAQIAQVIDSEKAFQDDLRAYIKPMGDEGLADHVRQLASQEDVSYEGLPEGERKVKEFVAELANTFDFVYGLANRHRENLGADGVIKDFLFRGNQKWQSADTSLNRLQKFGLVVPQPPAPEPAPELEPAPDPAS